MWRLQFNAAKHIVIARETLHFKNKGSKAVDKLVLCQPADLAPYRAFYEVRVQTSRHLSEHSLILQPPLLMQLCRLSHCIDLSPHMQIVQGTTEDAPELTEVRTLLAEGSLFPKDVSITGVVND